jgi:predicted nucleic acid-binding protein
MTVLVDSDVLIEVMRGRDSVIGSRWKQATEADDVLLACSPVSVAELWRGVRASEQESLKVLFDALVCVTVDKETGKRAGDIMRQYAASHNVEIADALIAASALSHSAELWTRNRKHYPANGIRFYESVQTH